MSIWPFLLFAGIYCVAVATPGPGVAALIARVLRQGLHGLPAMMAGFILGDLTWFILAGAGLSALAQRFAWAFGVIKFGGALYLAWVSWTIWRAQVVTSAPDAEKQDLASWPLFLGTLSLTLGNPKVIVFFLSIMPLVVDVQHLNLQVFCLLGLILMLTLTTVLAFYAALAHQARHLFRSASALRLLNRSVALVLSGAAAAIALR